MLLINGIGNDTNALVLVFGFVSSVVDANWENSLSNFLTPILVFKNWPIFSIFAPNWLPVPLAPSFDEAADAWIRAKLPNVKAISPPAACLSACNSKRPRVVIEFVIPWTYVPAANPSW